MTEEGWNHNTHYHERLLDALRHPCGRVLDVGCGRGAFARRLAGMATHVDAIDRGDSVSTVMLPGIVIRQHLLWRYSFAWTRTPTR